jgi:hypothetical protein
MTHTQPMFTHGEDLPLFTGQPVSYTEASFTPRVHYRQLRLEDSTMSKQRRIELYDENVTERRRIAEDAAGITWVYITEGVCDICNTVFRSGWENLENGGQVCREHVFFPRT